MINYHGSTFTWKSKPSKDQYYRYPGGFVGSPGDMYQVRFNIQSSYIIKSSTNDQSEEVFLGSPCRSEYTIASHNLFQVPSREFRMAFTKTHEIPISSNSSSDKNEYEFSSLSEKFIDHRLDIRSYKHYQELQSPAQIIKATLEGDLINVKTNYLDTESGLLVSIEFPVNLINVDAKENKFQVCTGPILVPDISSWKIGKTGRAFIAHIALSSLDKIEVILRREVIPQNSELSWLAEPVGLDRNELIDKNTRPIDYPVQRWELNTYHKTVEIPTDTRFYKSLNYSPYR